MTDDRRPPRLTTVPEELWQRFNRAVYDSGLSIVAITGSPTQATRYEIRHRKARIAAAGTRALTERESQALSGMAAGLCNEEIGQQLGISLDTVKSHAQRLFRKLGARDRANAVAIGYQRGYLGGQDTA